MYTHNLNIYVIKTHIYIHTYMPTQLGQDKQNSFLPLPLSPKAKKATLKKENINYN